MVGNDEARARVVIWLRGWKKGAKSLMLLGPPGTGKTTTVTLVAKKLGMNLIQLNASDKRTKGMLLERLQEALMSTSLVGEKNLVFLDEVDGLAGRADYGAIEFIRDSVKVSQNPIIMAANNPDSDEVRKLSSVAPALLFVKPPVPKVAAYLRRIASEEKFDVSEEQVERIASSANGDLRSALNSLQSGVPSTKDEEMTTPQAINSFLEAIGSENALKALRTYPGQPREKIRDLFSTIVRSKIHPGRKALALDCLSKADVLMGEIFHGGDWRLLRYLDPMLSTDLKAALGDESIHYSADAVPFPLQVRIWNDSKKLKDIGGLVGKRTGISAKGALVADIPFLTILCRSEEFREELVRSLGLEENYALFLVKESQRASKVS
jgi:replication factor C large subunit